jgi:hypothetical protein
MAEQLATYRAVLEEFFAGGLHVLLSSFVTANVDRFTPQNPLAPDEQSHGNYELFQQFAALVEEKLAELLAERAKYHPLTPVSSVQSSPAYLRYGWNSATNGGPFPLWSKGGLSAEALWDTVKELHESGETDLKSHCDFLLASTEYGNFVSLFAQYRAMGMEAPGSPGVPLTNLLRLVPRENCRSDLSHTLSEIHFDVGRDDRSETQRVWVCRGGVHYGRRWWWSRRW